MTTTNSVPRHTVRLWTTVLLVVIAAMCLPNTAWADNECFTYDATGTTITGLTSYGMAQTALTIPASVTTVEEYALADGRCESLYIEGNPYFESNAFDQKESLLGFIDFGSGMSVANMKALIMCLGTSNGLTTLEISGYTPAGDIDWSDMGAYLTSDVNVILPAPLVGTQIFGDAVVYGRFILNHDVVTYCCQQSFYDVDDGANMLFYIPDKLDTDPVDGLTKVHIKREHCIVGGQGVLIHNAHSTSSKADLPRIYNNSNFDNYQNYTYTQNMLVGVLTPTTITATEGSYTNMILYDGTFYPTTGGTLSANRAYLQVLTSDLENLSNLSFFIDENSEDGIETLTVKKQSRKADGWYSISGLRYDGRPSQPGIYIHDGHLETIK